MSRGLPQKHVCLMKCKGPIFFARETVVFEKGAGEDTSPYKISASVGADVLIGPISARAAAVRPYLRQTRRPKNRPPKATLQPSKSPRQSLRLWRKKSKIVFPAACTWEKHFAGRARPEPFSRGTARRPPGKIVPISLKRRGLFRLIVQSYTKYAPPDAPSPK